jgi:hypothetical protein
VLAPARRRRACPPLPVLLLILPLILLAGPLGGAAAQADEAVPAGASAPGGESPPQFSLTVYPSRVDLPRDTRHHTTVVRIKNGGTAAVPIQTAAAELTQAPDGTLTFHPSEPWSAASWVHARPQHFTLRPGRTREVHVEITVPDRPEPGERYVGLLFKAPPVPTGPNILIQRSIAAKLFIAVPGTLTRRIEAGPLQAPAISAGGPITLSVPVHNRGNVHHDYVHPHGLAARIGGRTLAFPDFTVLGGATRVVSAQWTDPPLFCLCRVSISVPDGGGEAVTLQATITVLPVREAAGTLIAALGLLLLLRAGRGYHRRALARARRQGYQDALGQCDDPGPGG